jgi:hypothetical protein
LGIKLCPKDDPENPAFPNHTDRDIWVNGFINGIEIAAKAIIGEFSKTTQKWVVEKIKIKQMIELNKGE